MSVFPKLLQLQIILYTNYASSEIQIFRVYMQIAAQLKDKGQTSFL